VLKVRPVLKDHKVSRGCKERRERLEPKALKVRPDRKDRLAFPVPPARWGHRGHRGKPEPKVPRDLTAPKVLLVQTVPKEPTAKTAPKASKV
jgi:hypothetical protein